MSSKSIEVGKLAKVIAVCMIIFHLILMTLAALGQSITTYGADPDPFNRHSAQLRKVRSVYSSQIGVREKGVNSGVEVEKYLKYVNLSKGNPWCAAFVCWVLGEAGLGNPRTGWSPAMFPASRVIWGQEPKFKEQKFPQNSLNSSQESEVHKHNQPGRQLATNNRQPTTGDIFGLYFPEKGRIAHVGFIDEWGDTWVTTVEGNTNVLGSREGDGVYRKRRLSRSIYKVARYLD